MLQDDIEEVVIAALRSITKLAANIANLCVRAWVFSTLLGWFTSFQISVLTAMGLQLIFGLVAMDFSEIWERAEKLKEREEEEGAPGWGAEMTRSFSFTVCCLLILFQGWLVHMLM